MSRAPTTEDRIWAVISHLSSLGFGMGIALPIIGWSDQRRKSKYASFQSLQALGYQSLGYTVWILIVLLVLVISGIRWIARPGTIENPERELLDWLLNHGYVLFGLTLLYFVLPVAAAVACAFGKDFRYPVLGKRLAGYLLYDAVKTTEDQAGLIEDRQDRWVAAMGHFSILIMLWGMLAPLATLILHGRRSDFLKFQSLQTLVYQAATTFLYFVVLLLYGFGLFSLILTTGMTTQMTSSPDVEMFGIFLFGVSLLFALLIALIVPLLHIWGQWVGFRVLKGDDYRYPLAGRLVDKWLSKKNTI